RVINFVDRVGEPSEDELRGFIGELSADGISLNERYVRRLVRIEVNRILNRSEVFDLDYDIVLRRAVEFLSN
ncbi:MAG: S41 family peptidase, partial [Spirochaetales bacterium]|nr:S41 family peptidase [Spirochaetales bacterium]